MNQNTIRNSERTSYLDLEVASRADICLAPQQVSSVCQHRHSIRIRQLSMNSYWRYTGKYFTQQVVVIKTVDRMSETNL